MSTDIDDDTFEEISEEEALDEYAGLPELPLEEEDEDVLSKEFVNKLVDKILQFMVVLVGHDLHPYQKPLARRMIESVVINDGEEVTALAARQSGKSETVANVVATLMVLMPPSVADVPGSTG